GITTSTSSRRYRPPTACTSVALALPLRCCARCGRWWRRYAATIPLVHADLRALQRLGALVAGQFPDERLAAAEMSDLHGRAFRRVKPMLSALQCGDDDREERPAFLGELIVD